MTDERILMSPPDVGALEEAAVVRAVRSGWVAPLGPEVNAFEDEIAERAGVSHAVALSSGTAALHLGLLGVGVERGDTVVVATMTFVASANAVTYLGAIPYFVDVREEDGNLDPEALRAALSSLRASGTRVGAVMPVDLLGKVADYTAIQTICDEFDVPLVEDAAEALGAAHAGRPAGSFGRVGALSFNGNKIMTTSGGGMLVTEDGALADRARYLSTQARLPVVHYEHEEVGFNYRLSNVLAALGRAQLSRLDRMIARRREIRERYRQVVEPVPGVRVFGGADDAEANCWLTALVLDPVQSPVGVEQLAAAFEAANVEVRPLWKPMHLQPAFQGVGGTVTGVAQRLFTNGLTLPSGSVHPETRIDKVVHILEMELKGIS